MAQRIMPAFEVEKLEGKVTVKRYSYDRKYLRDEDGEIVTDETGRKIIQSRQRQEKEVEVDAGWMVYFPRGHSVHITDEDEMRRLGFMSSPEFVDMNSEAEEDSIPQIETSLKDRVQRRTPRKRASTGSVSAEVAET